MGTTLGGRWERSRGAVAVEAALVTGPFILLLLAVIEGGFLLSSAHGVSDATRSASRVASAWGDQATADFYTLQAVAKGTSGVLARDINFVVIYKSDAAGSPPTATCRGGTSVADVCNVYRPADLARPLTDFGCQTPSTLDSYWCPTARKTALTVASGGPPDTLGVWVSVQHHTVSGLVGRSRTLTDEAVVRLEPRRV